MAIYVKDPGDGDFKPAPEGQHRATCCDVRDLGMVESTFGGKTRSRHCVLIGWQLASCMEDGRPFFIARRYTASLHRKANLRKDLEAWRGKRFSEKELERFDLESVIGAGALLQVVHNERDGTTYANVNVVMALPEGMEAPAVDPEYVRWQDRDQADTSLVDGPPPHEDDEEPPF